MLRSWLRAESADPVAEADEAMREVLALFPARAMSEGDEGGATVVVFRTRRNVESLLPDLGRLIEDGDGR